MRVHCKYKEFLLKKQFWVALFGRFYNLLVGVYFGENNMRNKINNDNANIENYNVIDLVKAYSG